MKKCKKCAVVCKYCYNYYKEDGTAYCKEFSHIETDCVTGEDHKVNHKCIKHNKDGNCKKYDENTRLVDVEILIERLKIYASKYLQEMYGIFFSGDNEKTDDDYLKEYDRCYLYNSVGASLIADLIDVLNEKESMYLKSTYDDSYLDAVILPTDSFYKKGKEHYEKKQKSGWL